MAELARLDDDRLEALLGLLLDECLEGTARAELDALLCEHPRAADRLVELSDMHVMLQWEHGTIEQETEESAIERALLDDMFSMALEHRRIQEIELKAKGLLQADLEAQCALPHPHSKVTDSKSGTSGRVIVIPKFVAWLGIAAVLGLAAMLIYQVLPEAGTDVANTPGQVLPSPAQPSPVGPKELETPVAELTDSYDLQWAGNAPTEEDMILPGRFKLTRGWVRLRTHHGVALVVEAPASFTIGGNNELALAHGQVVADVPVQAHGFTILTPSGRVIDHGTTFGVSVDAAGNTLAHVYDGEVEVVSSQAVNVKPVRLVVGQSAAVRPGQAATPAPAKPDQFVRQVPLTPYHALVMRSRPMCFWHDSVDPDRGRLIDRGWLAANGVPQGLNESDQAGVLDFRAKDDAEVTVAYRPELDQVSGFTAEAWIWVDRYDDWTQRIVSIRSADDAGWGFGVWSRDVERVGLEGTLCFSFYGATDVGCDEQVPRRQWIHVAASVADDGEIILYIDGRRARGITVYEPEALQARGGGRPVGGGEPLRIGNGGHPGGIAEIGASGRPEPLHGMLRAVALYDHALTPEVIAQHAQQEIGAEP